MARPADSTLRWSWRDDADVPPFPDEHPLIVFDGECVLCAANTRFVLRHDRKGRFRLTTAQGALGRALYRHVGLGPLPPPLSLAPRSEAREWEEDGRFRFEVAISLPLAGMLVQYRGWLSEDGGGAELQSRR